jgi:hypothetical protein
MSGDKIVPIDFVKSGRPCSLFRFIQNAPIYVYSYLILFPEDEEESAALIHKDACMNTHE